MKKCLTLCLCLAALVCLVLFTAHEANAATYGNLTYKVTGGEVTITDCNTSATGELVIPSTIDGYPVTTIGSDAFLACKKLTGVTIPDSVTAIGWRAFYNCESLTSITIPDSVTTIDYDAFDNCTSLAGIWVNSNNHNYSSDEYGILFNKDMTELIAAPGAIQSYTIPDSVNTIGYRAFDGCTSLSSVTIPNSVVTIYAEAFAWCESLKTITIPDSVTYLGDNSDDMGVFQCSGLTSVTIGKGLSSIPVFAFGETDLTSVTIPDSVTTIADFAFSNCTSLTNVTIPDSVTTIDSSAFAGCTSLTSITIPDSVTTIGNDAFYGCDSLKYNIYDNGKYLGNTNNPYVYLLAAVSNSITQITIHPNTKLIGDEAFYKCTSLTNVTIPDSVTTIGEFAFYYCTKLTSITILDSVTTIGGYAFYYCTSLTSITIPDSVTTIGGSAFQDCTSLTNVTIPDGVTTIGKYTFDYCISLTSITIPDSVISIGWGAFHNCESLTDVYYGGTEEQWNKIEIDGDNNPLLNATIHFGYEPEPVVGIVTQPKDAEVVTGALVQFAVETTGDVKSYEWQYKRADQWHTSNLDGWNTSELHFYATGSRDGYRYRCVVTFADGTSAVSEVATLAVETEIIILDQPKDQSAVPGGKALFTVKAYGEGLKCQWQHCPSDGQWTDLAGKTKQSLSVKDTVDNRNGQYRCRLTDTTGLVAYTDAVTFRVQYILKQPSSVAVDAKTKATFQIEAGLTEGFTYQWQYSRFGILWFNTTATGYNTDTLTVSAEMSRNGYHYRCVIKDAKGGKLISQEVRLYVDGAARITKQPQSCKTLAKTAEFTVKAENVRSYQWQCSRPGSEKWFNTTMEGAKTDTLQAEASIYRNGYRYRCVLTGYDGEKVYTEVAELDWGV